MYGRPTLRASLAASARNAGAVIGLGFYLRNFANLFVCSKALVFTNASYYSCSHDYHTLHSKIAQTQ